MEKHSPTTLKFDSSTGAKNPFDEIQTSTRETAGHKMGDLDNWQTSPFADTLVAAFESIDGGQMLNQRDGTFTKILQRSTP